MKNIFTINNDGTVDWSKYKLEADNYVCQENEVDTQMTEAYILAKWDSDKKQWYEAGEAPKQESVRKLPTLEERLAAIETALIDLI